MQCGMIGWSVPAPPPLSTQPQACCCGVFCGMWTFHHTIISSQALACSALASLGTRLRHSLCLCRLWHSSRRRPSTGHSPSLRPSLCVTILCGPSLLSPRLCGHSPAALALFSPGTRLDGGLLLGTRLRHSLCVRLCSLANCFAASAASDLLLLSSLLAVGLLARLLHQLCSCCPMCCACGTVKIADRTQRSRGT